MSNTNTEVLTTAYEKLQGALTQSNTVLPKLEEAVEKGNLDNYATVSDLEEKANQVDLQTQAARIDSFTKLAEGSTTGDAELIDARTVNGNTYTNLGGAVRAISSGEALNVNSFKITTGWKVGVMVQENGAIHDSDNLNGISITGFIPDKDLILNFDNSNADINYMVCKWIKDVGMDTSVNNQYITSNKFLLKKDCIYSISIKDLTKNPDVNEITDMSYLYNLISFSYAYDKTINEIKVLEDDTKTNDYIKDKALYNCTLGKNLDSNTVTENTYRIYLFTNPIIPRDGKITKIKFGNPTTMIFKIIVIGEDDIIKYASNDYTANGMIEQSLDVEVKKGDKIGIYIVNSSEIELIKKKKSETNTYNFYRCGGLNLGFTDVGTNLKTFYSSKISNINGYMQPQTVYDYDFSFDYISNGISSSYNDTFTSEVNVLDFGAKGDGLTDDTDAINNAIAFVINNYGKGTVKIPYKTYKIDGTLNFYSDCVSIESNDAILDFSNKTDTTTYGIVCKAYNSYSSDGDVGGEYSNQIRRQQMNYAERLYIKGNKNIKGIYYGSDNANVIATGFQFKNCVVTGFDIGVTNYSQSWVQAFINCNISNNNVGIDIPSGGTNYCERFTIINSNIHSCPVGIRVNTPHAHVHLIGCSMDYNHCNIDVIHGRVYLTDCHLESTKDTNYLYKVTNENSMISIINSEIYIAKNNYEMALVSKFGKFLIEKCYITDAGYKLDTFIKDEDGLGVCSVSNVYGTPKQIQPNKIYQEETITLNGSENWSNYKQVGNYYRVQINNFQRGVIKSVDANKACKITCDGYETMGDTYNYNTPTSKAIGCYYWGTGDTVLFITGLISELITNDLDGFKALLSSNNITVKYDKLVSN